MGPSWRPAESTGYLFFFFGGRGKEKFRGQILHHLFQAYFEPFLPVLTSTIAKYPKSIQWKNLGNLTVTRINFMIGQ
jgi:hypothetical protein